MRETTPQGALDSVLDDIKTFAGTLYKGRREVPASHERRLVAIRDELAGILDGLRMAHRPVSKKPNPLRCKCGGRRLPKCIGGMALYKEDDKGKRVYETRCEKCNRTQEITLPGQFPATY